MWLVFLDYLYVFMTMTTPKAAHKEEYGGQQAKKKKDIE